MYWKKAVMVTFSSCADTLVFSLQSSSHGSRWHRSLHRPCNCWPPPTRTRPPGTGAGTHRQSKPHRQPATSKPEPCARCCVHWPRRCQSEHANERSRGTRNGGRGRHRARLVGLVILGGEAWCSTHDCVLQLQPESIPSGDGHPLPHVPVSLLCSPDICGLTNTHSVPIILNCVTSVKFHHVISHFNVRVE